MLNNVQLWLGILGGIITLGKLFYDLTKIYNHLITQDRIFNNALETLDERLSRVDDDLNELHQEYRDYRAMLQDRITYIEKDIYRYDWKQYVDEGIISEEQLREIRKRHYS